MIDMIRRRKYQHALSEQTPLDALFAASLRNADTNDVHVLHWFDQYPKDGSRDKIRHVPDAELDRLLARYGGDEKKPFVRAIVTEAERRRRRSKGIYFVLTASSSRGSQLIASSATRRQKTICCWQGKRLTG